jgi:parallel beta-helix repeat protein
VRRLLLLLLMACTATEPTTMAMSAAAEAIEGQWSATGGTITPDGLYTAGTTPGSYWVVYAAGGYADTALVTITAPPSGCTSSATTICPGDNWQAKVNAAPTGTIFTIGAGIHRGQTVVAKTGQRFIGTPGQSIMSGANLLAGWTQDGTRWYVAGQTQEFPHTVGVCVSGTACLYPEDVYRNDVLLRRELSLAAVGPGEFYFDYAADRIYVGDDPAGQTLEAAATEYAFLGSPDGSGTDVVIDGLTVEKYANAAQYGAIGRSNTQRGWIIRNAVIRWNHGAGIRLGAIQVLTSRIHHNGQIGMVGGGDATTLVRGNEVDHNNTAGFAADWEGGGIKFGGGYFTGIQARSNNIHDNNGIGLWFDGYGDQFVFDSNTVVDNAWDGIKAEISYGGTIRHNLVTGNGFANPIAEQGDGIMVYAAGGSGLEITGNTLSGNKNAIMLFSANRGSGPAGPLVTANVNVHHNTVTLSGTQRMGAIRYDGSTGLWTTDNNRFEDNTYHLQGAPTAPFIWTNNALHTDAQWRAAGNDDTGTFNR